MVPTSGLRATTRCGRRPGRCDSAAPARARAGFQLLVGAMTAIIPFPSGPRSIAKVRAAGASWWPPGTRAAGTSPGPHPGPRRTPHRRRRRSGPNLVAGARTPPELPPDRAWRTLRLVLSSWTMGWRTRASPFAGGGKGLRVRLGARLDCDEQGRPARLLRRAAAETSHASRLVGPAVHEPHEAAPDPLLEASDAERRLGRLRGWTAALRVRGQSRCLRG